jgi:hypothetical protein
MAQRKSLTKSQVEKLTEIQQSTPEKASPPPFDEARKVGPDLRDPRMRRHQWPCYGNHQAAKPKANPFGQWIQCRVCNLRLEYTPRRGATAQATKVENEHQVIRMLQELETMLDGVPLSAELCLAMQKKVDAETQLEIMVGKHLSSLKAKPSSTQSKAKAKAKAYPVSTSIATPTHMVEEQEEMANLAHDLHNFLTAEEMDHVRTLVANRQAAINMEFGVMNPEEEQVVEEAEWVEP